MARKDAVFEPNDEPVVSREIDPDDDSEAVIDSGLSGPEVDSGEVGVVDGNDQIVEEAPGIREASDLIAPTGDPGDLSGGGRSALLPDDLGTGDDPAPDDLTGGDFGSSLLDDLAGDPTDGTGGGGGMSDIDDQTGWASVLGEPPEFSPFYAPSPSSTPSTPPPSSTPSTPPPSSTPSAPPSSPNPTDEDSGDDTDQDERETQEVPGDDTDDDDESQGSSQGGDDDETEGQGSSDGSRQGGDSPPESQSMPAPDDGTGGQPDESDFIGGPGNVDPASETEPAGPAGELIGGRGDIDPAPETEPAGPAGELIGGRGDIDPFDGKSSLLGEDSGDLAEMAAEADLGDIEIEVDDSVADADLGDDV